jgi:hypothetical protein
MPGEGIGRMMEPCGMGTGVPAAAIACARDVAARLCVRPGGRAPIHGDRASILRAAAAN